MTNDNGNREESPAVPIPEDMEINEAERDALEPDSLVLAARALPVTAGPEDLLSEKTILLGLQGAVVDRLGLLDLTVRPTTDVVSSRETDLDFVKRVNVEQFASSL